MQTQYSTEEVQAILASPPFVQVEGAVNLRDVGGYTIAASPNLRVKKGIVYRSGEPSHITEAGQETLRNLVKKVFDMRSASEIKAYQSAVPNVAGVEVVRVPLSEKESYDPSSLQTRWVVILRGRASSSYRFIGSNHLRRTSLRWGV